MQSKTRYPSRIPAPMIPREQDPRVEKQDEVESDKRVTSEEDRWADLPCTD